MWYIAHVLCLQEYTDPPYEWSIMENLIMINAKSSNDAYQKALLLGEEENVEQVESVTFEGRAFDIKFIGVRKVVSCLPKDERPSSGTEVSYQEYTLKSKDDISKLLNGDSVEIVLID